MNNMNKNSMTELENRIQSLLCNDLKESERDELLAMIARNDTAQKILAEMLQLRTFSRAAFGYNGLDTTIDTHSSNLMKVLSKKPALRLVRPASGEIGVRASRKIRWGDLLWPAAAILAVAVSICLGILSRQETDAVREQIATVNQRVSAWQMTAKDLADYRKVWKEIAAPAGQDSPWIVLKNGSGEFEYLPRSTESHEVQPVIVRCLLVSDDGTPVEKVNVLLPVGQTVKLSLGEMGQLAGLPVRCNVAAENRWISMDVKIGENNVQTVGVRGRVRINDKMSEIGRFKVDGKNLRVFLEAATLSNGMS